MEIFPESRRTDEGRKAQCTQMSDWTRKRSPQAQDTLRWILLEQTGGVLLTKSDPSLRGLKFCLRNGRLVKERARRPKLAAKAEGRHSLQGMPD